MKKSRIEELVRLMPESTNGLIPPLFRPVPQRLASSLASAVTDPGFGNRFVRAFITARQPLPSCVHESCLRRAFNHYAATNSTDDMVMVGVEQLLCDEHILTANVLKALLVCRDATLEQIAEWLDLSQDVVRFYSELHFNVRDRIEERAYIASLVFPGGRLNLLRTDAVDDLSTEQRLIQAGCVYGANEVLILVGMKTDAELPSQEESKLELARSILANAAQLVRSGYLNSKSAPGLKHATDLIATQAQVGPQTTATDDFKTGIGSLGMSPGDAIEYTLKGITAHQNGQLGESISEAEIQKIRDLRQTVLNGNTAVKAVNCSG